MATEIDRTWYNTLQDDSGAGNDGSIWDKADVDALLDAINALLAGNLVFGGTLQITGALSGVTSLAMGGALTGVTSLTMSGALTGATRVSVTGGTITSDAPVFNSTQAWNAGGVTFNGIKLDVTDTASAAASLLLDLQVGGASKLKVGKDGTITAAAGVVGTKATLATGTITTSQPVLTGTQTWNAGAVTFKGISLDVTDTASAAASLLLDLLVGGVSQFKVQKDGSVGIGVTPTSVFHVQKAAPSSSLAQFVNTSATNPSGFYLALSGADPNNATQFMFRMDSSAGIKAAIYSNGGFHNFSANNVNLSDLGAKDITGPAPKNMRGKIQQIKFYRGRYKGSTRGHDDLMWGAQDIVAIDPEWADVWQEEERDETGAVLKPRLLGTRDHLIFMANVAATAELIGQVDDLAERLSRLERAA